MPGWPIFRCRRNDSFAGEDFAYPLRMVSVVIPAYNYAKFLPDAIESALGQGSPGCPVEVVVLDDGSTDDTPAVAAAFGSAIRYQRQENAGLPAARNAGMRAASHDLVIFLDADDALLPGAVTTLIGSWKTCDPPPAVLASRNLEMDAEGRPLGPIPAPGTGAISPVSARDLVIRNRFATTVLADRRILLALGGFDESLPASEDRDMWIRVAASHPVLLLDRLTLAVRKHGANMSKAATRQSLAIDRVLAKAFADPALRLDSRDRRLARAVRHYQTALMRSNAGETRAALAEMARSLALVPLGWAGDDVLPPGARYRGLASLFLKSLFSSRSMAGESSAALSREVSGIPAATLAGEGVTVLIPSYNYARYLPEAIDSALAQTHPHVEVLVIDDGSTDETPEVLSRYGDRIRSVRQENAGLCAARNRGLAEATHEFVVLLDADDVLDVKMIEESLKALERLRPPAAVVGHISRRIDEKGEAMPFFGIPEKRSLDCTNLDFLLVNRFAPIVLAHRATLQDCGGFDPAFRASEDRDLWVRVSARHRVHRLPDVLSSKRCHASNMSGNWRQQDGGIRLVFARAGEQGYLRGWRRFWWLKIWSYHYYQLAMMQGTSNPIMAVGNLARSILLWPVFPDRKNFDQKPLFRLRLLGWIVKGAGG